MLKVEDLTVGFKKDKEYLKAVNEISLSVQPGQILGLVGESGCGKSTALFSIIGLIPTPGKMLSGNILLNDVNIAKFKKEQWRKIRGKKISMIFQDPMTALNPAYPVGEQIREILKVHKIFRKGKSFLFNRKEILRKEKERVIELMREVRIPSPENRYYDYPHQFSGGMQQRILVAIAIAAEPDLLLADEPTTALDVTIQAQILDVLREINERRKMGIILVTHDLSVASEFCDDIAVMYAGKIVEQGSIRSVIDDPKHPYTQGLLKSIPIISKEKKKIEPIKGNVIDLLDLDGGCGFYNRCPFATKRCKKEIPMIVLEDKRSVRCILYEKGGDTVAN